MPMAPPPADEDTDGGLSASLTLRHHARAPHPARKKALEPGRGRGARILIGTFARWRGNCPRGNYQKPSSWPC